MHTRIWIFTDITEARYANVDPLTGLPNRRAYAANFPQSVLADDDGLVRSVSILDVDNFKLYNDRYGHAAGDAVLRQIGTMLRERLTRSDDQVYRIGGEEFLISCRFRNIPAVAAFFEGIRRCVDLTNVDHAGNPPHNRVTASFGVVVFNGPQAPEEVFRRADNYLYEAKATGRNRVKVGAL